MQLAIHFEQLSVEQRSGLKLQSLLRRAREYKGDGLGLQNGRRQACSAGRTTMKHALIVDREDRVTTSPNLPREAGNLDSWKSPHF